MVKLNPVRRSVDPGKRMGSIRDVVDDGEVLVETLFNEFTETKSSLFLKR